MARLRATTRGVSLRMLHALERRLLGTTPEQSRAMDLVMVARTPEQHEAASRAMRAAFPSIAEAYEDPGGGAER
jgi:hypothetical protein